MNAADLKQRLQELSPSNLTADDFREIHDNVQKRISREHQGVAGRANGRSMFANVAAAVAGLLIIGGGLLYAASKGTVGIRNTPTATTNNPRPATSVVLQSSPELNGIQMFPDRTGWMLSAGGQLLHTTNGAATWTDVGPAPQVSGQIRTTSIQGGENAWVAIGTLSGQHAATVVYHTDDGGRSWTHHSFSSNSSLPPEGVDPSYLTFLNDKQGWMVTQVPDFGMGGTTPGSLYETTDGGASWRQVSHQVANNIVSFAWVDFVSPTIGFTVGAHQNMQADTGATDGNSGRLYVTKNGGASWEPVQLNLPHSKYLSILKPMFFSQQSGVLPVVVRTQAQGDTLTTFATSDGGQTWSEQGSQLLPSTVSGIDFISTTEGYLLCGRTLYHTADGGLKWHQSGALPGNFQSSSATVDFVGRDNGWVYPQTLQVYHTADGGKTWTTFTATATGN